MRIITNELIAAFRHHLHEKERADPTIEKYLRIVMLFMSWLAGQPVTKDIALAWKDYLLTLNLKTTTVNGRLSAVNSFFRFCGWEDCRLSTMRIQRRAFRDAGQNLVKAEYEQLVATAMELGRIRLALLLETICSTGIRVSELKFITVAAARAGKAEVRLKGKIRTILMTEKLREKLLAYAKENKIASGEIFVTGSGKSMSRHQIWAEMKALCDKAGVESSKVFPHNLRHLFARMFYESCHDIVKLADVMGHSSTETTRLYLISSGEEHARVLDRLGLVS